MGMCFCSIFKETDKESMSEESRKGEEERDERVDF